MIVIQYNVHLFYFILFSSLVDGSMSKLKLGPQESEDNGEWAGDCFINTSNPIDKHSIPRAAQ